jgi:putative FmdB family regulatory protein
MPTYVYACDTCQVQFEKFQSFNDEPLRSCPTCQNAVRRVIQATGVVFKGSGWHINDYRANKGGESAADSTVTTPVTTPAAAAGDATPAAPAAAPAPATPSTTSSATDA